MTLIRIKLSIGVSYKYTHIRHTYFVRVVVKRVEPAMVMARLVLRFKNYIYKLHEYNDKIQNPSQLIIISILFKEL